MKKFKRICVIFKSCIQVGHVVKFKAGKASNEYAYEL